MLSGIRNISRLVREAGFEFPGEAVTPWSVLLPSGADVCEQAPFVPRQHHGQRRTARIARIARPAAAPSRGRRGRLPVSPWSASPSGLVGPVTCEVLHLGRVRGWT